MGRDGFTGDGVVVVVVVGILVFGGGLLTGVVEMPNSESVEYDADLEASTGDTTAFNRSAAEAAAVAAINDAREREGMSRLTASDDLRQQARSWSRSMAAADRLSHDDLQCAPGGENVAQTFWQTSVETDQGVEKYTTESELGEAIAQQWLTSPTHRDSIMQSEFSTTAIGLAQRGDAVYATQRLC